jgi:NDP-sugar pyrophosphorylase family protein
MSDAGWPERALILAGGLGTRLASVVADRPKVLAPVGGRPFLDVLIDGLAARGLRHFVLLLGSRHEQVLAHLEARRAQWPACVELAVSVESSPLGTAGAVKLAQASCGERFFLFNGDTYFDVDLAALVAAHERAAAVVTIAAAQVDDADRYGRIEVTPGGLVARFREKDVAAGPGLINAGVYLVEPRLLGYIPPEQPVSLERDTFPALLAVGLPIAVSAQSGAFFDIGTPSSYRSFTEFWGGGQPRPEGSNP